LNLLLPDKSQPPAVVGVRAAGLEAYTITNNGKN